MTCFVGLVWQGSTCDDILKDQIEMDIIQGRLGLNAGKRDSIAQITTIESPFDCYGSPRWSLREEAEKFAGASGRHISGLEYAG
ncbi:Uncharacterized protein FKW44_025078 [Caligus rogercresseyi]|uniref:Uncharacterized protein n=1 Tax=Caligus rogercresseyi TaxID=217165 RepID=A0A7T8JTB3_CALRO|nr:Uncharacterized protein FKW44_025078 [Caligus rogercresseyi]